MGSSYTSINEVIAPPTPPAPVLTSLSPNTDTAGSGTVTVTCTGNNFTRQSVVHAQGVPLQTSFGSATTLTATVPRKSTPGGWSLTVVTQGVSASSGQVISFT